MAPASAVCGELGLPSPERGVDLEPGGTRMMGPGGPGGTHEDLDALRWKNMGAGCTSPGLSALLSTDTVDLCVNCDKHEGAENGPKL